MALTAGTAVLQRVGTDYTSKMFARNDFGVRAMLAGDTLAAAGIRRRPLSDWQRAAVLIGAVA